MPVPSSINDLSTTAGSNSPAGSESPTTTDNYFRAHASFIAELRDDVAAAGTAGATKAGIQAQTYTAFITGGTSTAYTLTPSPVIGSLIAGQRFRVKFNAANTSTNPTLAVNGLAATALKVYDSAGVKQSPTVGAFALNMLTDVEYDGTDYVVLDPLPLPVSMGNLLINGNFNINQRGYVSATATTGANQYTLDRWRVVTSGQNLTFSASGNGNQVTAPAGGIEQVIEGANIGAAAAVINWSGTATCTVDGNAKAKGEAVTLTPGTNCTVKFVGGTVSQAQLEYGSTPTPFKFLPVSTELTLCQRYYEVLELAIAATNASVVAMAANFVVPKRTAPTFTRLGGGLASGTAPDAITATATGYFFQRVAANTGGLYSASAEL